jgi:Aldo/keto reductase family
VAHDAGARLSQISVREREYFAHPSVQLAALNEVSKLRESRCSHGDEDEFRTYTMVRGQFLAGSATADTNTAGPKNIERSAGRDATRTDRAIAARHGATPAHIAIAWLLARSPVMLPIPGTSSVHHLEENVAAAGMAPDERAELA